MRIAILPLVLCSLALAQTPEVATKEESFTFKAKVNLVQVTVVVRDKKGSPVGNLKKEDFRLFDRGKPQDIAKFSVEQPGTRKIPVVNLEADGLEGEPRAVDAATQFIAYLFDDLHTSFEDMVRTRDAVRKHLASITQPGARFAVYTTSGQVSQDFTDDRDALIAAISRLRQNSITRGPVADCPDINLYMADLIVNKHSERALGVATRETQQCAHLTPELARTYALGAAQRVLGTGEHESQLALYSLSDTIRRMGSMPGERTLLLLSPGFIRMSDQFSDESKVIDLATRLGVVVNSLDARGLYTDVPDISKPGTAVSDPEKSEFERGAARAAADIMAEMADGTGGKFFENSNDYNGGVDRLSGAPSVYYVLSFSPQNLKLDGAFHALKVQVKEPPGLDVRARRGYYAPRHLSDADAESKEEISQALFSREEMTDIPLALHTQFFKASDDEARLQVSARIDVRNLHFRKAEGTNSDDVALVAALFDRNGNFIQGVSKVLKMKLKDATLETRLGGGLTVRSDFKVAPGTYIIRLVIRDAEGQMMAARNGAVEIP